MNKNITRVMLYLSILLFPLCISAKSITLYEEPKTDAKVVSTLDSNAGIIPIYTPEKGDWMKVADPRNGNVGWVKINDLGNAETTEYTFTQRFINTGTSPQTYQIFQFGGKNKMSPEQVQNMLKQQQIQQQQLQENINKSMQKMIDDMNTLYHWNTNLFNNNIPFIMPVIVIPAQQNPLGAKNSSTDESKTSKKSAE